MASGFCGLSGIIYTISMLFFCLAGFVHLAHGLQESGLLTAVYDLTIAYPDNMPQTEVSFLLRSPYTGMVINDEVISFIFILSSKEHNPVFARLNETYGMQLTQYFMMVTFLTGLKNHLSCRSSKS